MGYVNSPYIKVCTTCAQAEVCANEGVGMWNASMRDFERDIIPMARDEGMALCPYGTLGQGRFQIEAVYKEREQTKEGRNLVPLSQHDKDVSAHLEKIANKKGTNLHSIALAYCLQKHPYVFPIVGGRKISHIQGNIDALDVYLSDEDIAEVEKGYEFDPGFPHTFLSGTLISGSKPWGAQGPQDVFMTKDMGTFDWVEGQKPVRPE